MEVKSDAAIVSEVESPLQTRDRNESLLHRTMAHTVGQFSTSRAIVNLGSFSTRRPSSAWKDSSASNSEELSTQYSEPYNRIGIMQLSMMLRDDSGLSRPWKAPSWPLAKNAALAFCIRSFTHALLEVELSHITPRHFTDFSIGRDVSRLLDTYWR